MEDGTNVCDVQVPLKLSKIKPIHAKWLLGLYDHLRNSSEAIIKGFEMASIKETLEMEFSLKDPFLDLDCYKFYIIEQTMKHSCAYVLCIYYLNDYIY